MHDFIKNTSAFLAGAAIIALAYAAALTSPAFAEKTVMVGGAAMFPTKNIIENAVNSKDHTTLVAAVKAAGLVDTLQGPGPFTVFAPTNARLRQAAGRHGRDAAEAREQGQAHRHPHLSRRPRQADVGQELTEMVDKMGGKAELKTVNGEPLTVKRIGEKHLAVYDPEGGAAQHHHRRRDAVERRHPRHRHRRAAELIAHHDGCRSSRRPSTCVSPRKPDPTKRGLVLPGRA